MDGVGSGTQCGRFRVRGGVAGKLAISDGGLQGVPQHRPDVAPRACGEAARAKGHKNAVHVLARELVQADGTEGWEDVGDLL